MSQTARLSDKVALKEADKGDTLFFNQFLGQADSVAFIKNVRDAEGCSVNHRAARNGQTELCRLLISQYGFDPNDPTRAKTPLYEAACQGHASTVSLLIGLGADVHRAKHNEWNPLHAASSKGYADVVELLLNACSASSSHDATEILEAQNKEGSTALSLACREGHSAVAEILIKYGADVNHKNRNSRVPLLSACASGDLETVKVILRAGCRLEDDFVIDSSGANPLHEVASQDNHKVVEQMIIVSRSSRSWLRQADKAGRLPLHIAAVNDQSIAFRLLAMEGLDTLEAREASGATPLFLASVKGNIKVVSAAVQFGADPKAVDHSKRSCIEVAKAWKRADVLAVLERRKIVVGDSTPLWIDERSVKLSIQSASIPMNESKQDKDVESTKPERYTKGSIASSRDANRESESESESGVTLMDTLGLGTYKLFESTYDAVLHSLKSRNYASLDMAELYGNEHEVGRAIDASGVARDKLFLTSKIWNNNTSSGNAREALKAILARLNVTYLDLILIHWPCAGFECAFGDLLKCRSEGLVKFVGVSNFLPSQIDAIANLYGEYPAVNQIEMSCFFYRPEQLKYFQQRGIVVQVYRSLGIEGFVSKNISAGSMDHELVRAIAQSKHIEPNQILLRWCIQHGVCILPKSRSKDRIDSNSRVFGFELTAEEMSKLDGLSDPRLESEWMNTVFKPSTEKDVIAPQGSSALTSA